MDCLMESDCLLVNSVIVFLFNFGLGGMVFFISVFGLVVLVLDGVGI